MAQYNFEGNIDGISERQLEYINTVITELGLQNNKVTFENVGSAGDNYIANVKRIIIEGENESLNIVAKMAPTIESLRQLMNTQILFRNEHIMYTEVLPKLVQLQKEEVLSETELLRYAKCYGSLSEAPNEVILLEDLKVSNYTMLDRFVSLSDEHVRSVLKNIALLHSMSYVLKYKEPETFNNLKENLSDMFAALAQTDHMKHFFQALQADTLNLLKGVENTSLIKNIISGTLDFYTKLAKVDKNSKYSVILQGDAWTNNIMFRFDEDKFQDSILIDYQASRVSSPVVDILYMIFNCTDYDTRRKNFYDWIDCYHTELEKSLANYGLKVNFVYPRDKLDADLKSYGKTMFGLSILLASVLIRKSEDASNAMDAMKNENIMDDYSQQTQAFLISQLDGNSIELYKNRVVGLIRSFTDFGLL